MERRPAEGAPVPRTVFNVADLPEHQRFDAWRESIACIFEVDADPEIRNADFFGAVDASMYGPLMLARTTSRGQRWQRTAAMIARDGMDHYMIQYYETGSQVLRHGNLQVEQPPGGLLVYDLSRPVQAENGTFTCLSLVVPRALLAESLRAPDDQHLQALPAIEPMVALLRDHMLSMKRVGSRLSAAQANALVPTTLGLVAACLNAAGDEGAAAEPAVAVAAMVTARRLIDVHLSDERLTPAWLAQQLGMSRAKLYRMFEPLGGIAQYIRDRRLRRAMLELRTPELRHRPIYDVALRAGFASETTFGRAFRQRYGVSPREARQQAIEPRPATGGGGPDRRYEEWLHHLAV